MSKCPEVTQATIDGMRNIAGKMALLIARVKAGADERERERMLAETKPVWFSIHDVLSPYLPLTAVSSSDTIFQENLMFLYGNTEMAASLDAFRKVLIELAEVIGAPCFLEFARLLTPKEDEARQLEMIEACIEVTENLFGLS